MELLAEQQVPLTAPAAMLPAAPVVAACAETVTLPKLTFGIAAGITAGASVIISTPLVEVNVVPAATVNCVADPLVNVRVPLAVVAGT